MKIAIDIDGVISDFVDSFSKIVWMKYKKKLTEQQILQHDLYKVLGIEKEEVITLIKETLTMDLKLQPGAVKSINELSKDHEIILITGRPRNNLIKTKKW